MIVNLGRTNIMPINSIQFRDLEISHNNQIIAEPIQYMFLEIDFCTSFSWKDGIVHKEQKRLKSIFWNRKKKKIRFKCALF
jgi:hypothetical protein